MKISLAIITLLFFTNSFAQPKYWSATVTTGEYGLLKTNFILQDKGAYSYGTTKPEANKRIIGGIKGSLAKGMFQKNGSMMELDSISINNEILTGFLILGKKKYYLQGKKEGNDIRADIVGKASGKVYGLFTAREVAVLEKPQDYKKAWQEIKSLTETNIYKKTVLDSKEWKSFVSYMNNFSARAEDDAEFMYGFFYKKQDLPFSHYIMTGNKENAGAYAIAGVQGEGKKLLPSLSAIDEQTYLLDVPAFNFKVADIDSLMLKIVNSTAKNLIIDLRENPGGDMEGGMRICEYIANKTLYGGVMLSRHYWNNHTAPPPTSDYDKFKIMNNANYEWFKNEVKNGIEGLCLVTNPMPQTFKGKVFILTSNITASASEPLVYTLQKENIATVVGGKTAGAMVSMQYFYTNNFEFTIPILDYYTFDGKRLDMIGVEPNVVCDPKDALELTLKIIKDGK